MNSQEPSDRSGFRSRFETIIVHPLHGNGLHGKKTVLIALGANISVGIIKLFAGVVGRHSALMSEALHSFADAINSGFLLIGLQKGSRAPDKTHPFGYGLETTLWAMLAESMMLILAGWSMTLGISRFSHPQPFGPFSVSVVVLVISIVLEILAVNIAATAVLEEKGITRDGWFQRVGAAAKHVQSIISPTTRFVFYEDTIALIGALIALIAVILSHVGPQWHLFPAGFEHIPDAIASVLIGLMLLGLAVYLFAHNSRGLTGSSAGPQLEERIRNFVMSLNGVSQVHDLRTIDYGLSGVVVHMRVEVDPAIQVKDVDDLTERIRDRVQARLSNIKEVIIEVLADETNMEWRDQFYRLVEQGCEQKVLEPREAQMLKNVYEFTQIVVGDIMVPRMDVDCLEVSESVTDLMDLVIKTGHTRIPVYEEDIDNMLGAIHVKEIFEYLRKGELDVSLRSLVNPFDIYPENKAVSDLLEEFKRKKIQIAMVADEHGGFAGIVTIEDLLEEIVGEIWDEFDDDTDMLEQPEPNRMVLNGRFEIDELNERFGLKIPDEEFNTVGGFVFGLLGREPKEGDSVNFEDMTFTVLKMDNHRVDQVEMIGPDPFVSKREEPSAEPASQGANGNGTH